MRRGFDLQVNTERYRTYDTTPSQLQRTLGANSRGEDGIVEDELGLLSSFGEHRHALVSQSMRWGSRERRRGYAVMGGAWNDPESGQDQL